MRREIKPHGEMAERFNAPVLKTDEGNTSGGSNPSLSAFFLNVFLTSETLFFPAKILNLPYNDTVKKLTVMANILVNNILQFVNGGG